MVVSEACLFPQPVSGLSSGVMTPSTDFLRSQSPDKPLPEMNDLLSALRNISTSEEPVQEQAEQVRWCRHGSSCYISMGMGMGL